MEQNVSITVALKEAAGIDDRSILFVPLLFAIYFGTVGLGTAIVTRQTSRAKKAREAGEVAPTVLGNPSPTDADAETLLSPPRARTVDRDLGLGRSGPPKGSSDLLSLAHT